MRGTVSASSPWDVMVDLFFYREPEETKEEGAGDADAYAERPEPTFPAPEQRACLLPLANLGGVSQLCSGLSLFAAGQVEGPAWASASVELWLASAPVARSLDSLLAAAGEYTPQVAAEPAPAPAGGADWEAAPAPVVDSQGALSSLWLTVSCSLAAMLACYAATGQQGDTNAG